MKNMKHLVSDLYLLIISQQAAVKAEFTVGCFGFSKDERVIFRSRRDAATMHEVS